MLAEYEKKSAFPSNRKEAAKLLSSIVKSTKQFEKNGILNGKIIETPVGSIIVISNEKNLLMLNFVASKHMDGAIKKLVKLESKAIVENEDAKPFDTLELELQKYFKGELSDFKTPYEINKSESEFQRSVWNQIMKIEYGETKSYFDVATAIKNPKASRAVANACGKNPIAIIVPCHRVLGANCLGGFGADVDCKKFLLNLEKQEMKMNKV